MIKDEHVPCNGVDHCLHKENETMAEEYWVCCLGNCDYIERRNK